MKAVRDGFERFRAELARARSKERAVQREELRDVDDRRPSKAGLTLREKHVPWRLGETKVRRDRDDHDGRDRAAVERVRLDDENGTRASRARTHRVRQVHPPDVTARYFHDSEASARSCISLKTGSSSEASVA